MKYSYDRQSNVLRIKIVDRPFDYAEEMGNFVVHFDKENKPVYIEILNADQFIKETASIINPPTFSI
jgi:uncharacterized protein YuzE